MEMVLALAIGVLTGSGVWLLLRPRTFQVIMGLALLSYAVNLFIFSMGRLGLAIGKEPVLQPGLPQDLAHYADPMPQALALTAIVISFGLTAFLLALAYRSWQLTGDDLVEDDVEDRRIAREGDLAIDEEVIDQEALSAATVDADAGGETTGEEG